jgi:hypothetical protein
MDGSCQNLLIKPIVINLFIYMKGIISKLHILKMKKVRFFFCFFHLNSEISILSANWLDKDFDLGTCFTYHVID